MLPWIFVCPASRGIGLALTRQLLRTTDLPIIATARKDLDHTKRDILQGLEGDAESRLTVLKLDVTDEDSIAEAASTCASKFPKKASHLHLSVTLPGILHPEKSPSQISGPAALETFRINTIGPLLLLKHFSSFLPRKSTALPSPSSLKGLPPHAVWACLSARVGSISDNNLGGWYTYRASKAALNQVVKTFDNHLKVSAGEKALAVGWHPGTVKTGLSKEFWGNVKEGKLFSAEFAAERLCEVVRSVGLEGRGKCWDWSGKEVPP